MQKDIGVNKVLLPFGSANTLLEYQQNKLSALFDSIFVSIKKSTSTFAIQDENTVCGVDVGNVYAPILGFYSALLRFNEAFFIAVDTPFFDALQIKQMQEVASKNKNVDAIIATSNGKLHPTIAIYRNTMLPSLAWHISQDKLKLTLYLSTLNIITVEFDESFTQNINDKKGYDEACLRI